MIVNYGQAPDHFIFHINIELPVFLRAEFGQKMNYVVTV